MHAAQEIRIYGHGVGFAVSPQYPYVGAITLKYVQLKTAT